VEINEEKISLIRIFKNKQEEIDDLVAREVSFSIILNGKKIVTLNCSPENYKSLGLGFLFTMGIIQGKKEIKSIKIDKGKSLMNIEIEEASSLKNIDLKDIQMRVYQSEERKEKSIFNDFSLKIEASQIFELILEMQRRARLFKLTGGVHSCALANKNGDILIFKEDISRYNTIDKILGEAFINDIIMMDKIIVTSCRITSGILRKIIAARMPIIISRAAPTDQSIKLAQKAGITLGGFVRGKKMNVYSYPQRIKI